MIEVVVHIEVAPEPAQVFDYWADWSNNPEWQTGMKACTWTSERPLKLGSTYDQEASFLGRPIVSSFEVVDYEPGVLVRIKTTGSSLPLDITRQVAPRPTGGTLLTATIKGDPQGPMRLFNPLTQRMVRRNVTADYERLRELLNSGRFHEAN